MDEHQDEIQLTRGGRKITLTKRPEYLAVRLKQGRAANSTAPQACCGTPPLPIRHVGMMTTSDIDIVTHVYSIDDTAQGVMVRTDTLSHGGLAVTY